MAKPWQVCQNRLAHTTALTVRPGIPYLPRSVHIPSHTADEASNRTAPRRALSRLGVEVVALLRLARDVARERRRALAGASLAVILVALALVPFDHPFDDLVLRNRSDTLQRISGWFRFWGRGLDTGTWLGLLMLGSALPGRRRWRRAALCALLAAVIAGIAVNVVRVSTGRPRPRAEGYTHWVGPTLTYRLQSFPSGHCAASAASATALLWTAPWIGVPALLSAGGVALGSLYTRNHYLTDTAVGLGMGALCGALLGAAGRRRAAEDERARRPQQSPTHPAP
jgi:membrane-associated phospholipid phosphatase